MACCPANYRPAVADCRMAVGASDPGGACKMGIKQPVNRIARGRDNDGTP